MSYLVHERLEQESENQSLQSGILNLLGLYYCTQLVGRKIQRPYLLRFLSEFGKLHGDKCPFSKLWLNNQLL